MALITGTALAMGGIQAGLGVLQGIAGYNAKKQEYVNQKAFQEANSKFASWQAGFNARISDANKQHDYWKDTVNYNREFAWTNSLRNVELNRSIAQAEVVAETRAAAGASYIRDSEAISQQYQEASMQEAVAAKQYKWRSLQARASAQVMNQEGRSVDRIINDFSRQEGDFLTLQDINSKLRGRQYSRSQAGQIATYLSQWNSQSFYAEQPYMDPLAPFAPLPTLITPAAPTFTGGAPSKGAAMLNVASGIMSGVNLGLQVNKLGGFTPGGQRVAPH
mgnify:CR=1 FL=1